MLNKFILHWELNVALTKVILGKIISIFQELKLYKYMFIFIRVVHFVSPFVLEVGTSWSNSKLKVFTRVPP